MVSAGRSSATGTSITFDSSASKIVRDDIWGDVALGKGGRGAVLEAGWKKSALLSARGRTMYILCVPIRVSSHVHQ